MNKLAWTLLLPAWLLSATATAEHWQRLVDQFSLDACAADDSVLEWTRHYAAHPDFLDQVLNRAEPWVELLATEIEVRRLPGEIALVPILESGFDAYAFSRRGAAGAWQLMEQTALELGLTIDESFDARRDLPISIAGGLNYLETLYWRLGRRWDLALAAYNAGPGRVGRLHLNGQIGPQPWHSEALPGETRVYLARLMGLACLLAAPDRFEYRWPAPVPARRAVSIQLPAAVDLARLVVHADLDPASLVALNAGLGQIDAPVEPGRKLHVHASDHKRVLAALDLARPSAGGNGKGAQYHHSRQLLLAEKASRRPESRNWHQVVQGETLWSLSQRYSVGVAAIRRSNGMDSRTEVRTGELIQIPPGEPALLPDQYRVQPGDTIWGIARDQGVPVRALKKLNGLDTGAVLQEGQVIELGESRCCDQIPRLFEPIATGL